jgi:hypothetical protein
MNPAEKASSGKEQEKKVIERRKSEITSTGDSRSPYLEAVLAVVSYHSS